MRAFVRALSALVAATTAALLPAVNGQTLVDVAAGDERFTTLVTAVSTLQPVVDALSDPDAALTVFAPTNEAFEKIDVSKFLTDEWSAHLASILFYHVLGTEVLSSDLVEVGQTAKTLEGSSVEVTSLDPIMINTANVIEADIMTDNGVIHVIDDVLLPPSATETIVDFAAGNPGIFSTLVGLVQDAGLVDALSADGPLTVFAPTNEAFAALGEEKLNELGSDIDALSNVLKYHVLPRNFVFGGLDDPASYGSREPTLEGGDLFVEVTDGDVTIDGNAKVETPNILARNGVIHVIDKVLIPPTETADASTSPPGDDSGSAEGPPSIVEIAASNDDFSTLVAALGAVGLVGTLEGDGPFTVFAPVNSGFDGVDVPKLLEDEWSAHLKDILLYHVLEGKIMSTDLSLDLTAPTLEGSPITVTSYPDPVKINDSTVIQPDIEASNGVVHVVDKVLLPMSATTDIVDLVTGDGGDLSTLADLVGLADLVEALQGPGPFTVFAPDDEAFAKLPAETVDALKADRDALKNLLLYHVVEGNILSTDLTDGATVETLQGDDITVSLDPTMINDANVIAADILVKNGVVHVIDRVLIPPEEEEAPTSPGGETEIASAGGYARLVSVDYRGPGQACVEVLDSVARNGQRLVLGDCKVDKGGWRYSESSGMIHSELDEAFCMQAGYDSHEIVGNVMRIGHCSANNPLQKFVWQAGHGLRPKADQHTCVVWRGVEADTQGDPIILLSCDHVADKLDWVFE